MIGLPRDWRRWMLAGAALALALTLLHPRWPGQRPVFTQLWIVDITRSMNVTDYRHDGATWSRLNYVKQTLVEILGRLPCGSRIGLGVFTDRRTALLFEPFEVCAGYAPLRRAIEELDWRMAWAADSRIAEGLHSALELTSVVSDARLAFFTDGQEAPPINPRYAPLLDAYVGRVRGWVVGVGDLIPAAIPKFDERGTPQGFYRAEEVPHRATFGLPVAPDAVEGSFHDRNAPFGGAWVLGQEHLSALREDYLRDLARRAGLGYHRLQNADQLAIQLTDPAATTPTAAVLDLRAVPATVALLMLLAVYAVPPACSWWQRRPMHRAALPSSLTITRNPHAP